MIFLLDFWNCSDSGKCFVFHFISILFCRIKKCIETDEVKKEDVTLLKKELVAVFITALQQDK
jgi:hypothetical protein